MQKVINILVAGLGGQGVLTASDLIAFAAFESGFDVKKSELKGMSQRGGSVTSDVRFGEKVWSPMIPSGEADFLLVLEPTQKEPNLHMLKKDGVIIMPTDINLSELPAKQTLNTAMVGAISNFLPIKEDVWMSVIKKMFKPAILEKNIIAFSIGRSSYSNLNRNNLIIKQPLI
jgi:indolepyruvate ferredoxin oxidoreductase beta subunit